MSDKYEICYKTLLLWNVNTMEPMTKTSLVFDFRAIANTVAVDSFFCLSRFIKNISKNASDNIFIRPQQNVFCLDNYLK
jgi:hypothetical protein